MILFWITYALVFAMVLTILLITTSEGLVLLDASHKISTIITMILISVLWFPVLLYITIWTIIKKTKKKDLDN